MTLVGEGFSSEIGGAGLGDGGRGGDAQWVSPLAELPGAVVLDDLDADQTGEGNFEEAPGGAENTAPEPAAVGYGAIAHYGDPSGEQWALEAGRALVDRPDLAIVEVRGPDRLTWLTSISSQVLTGIEAGESRELLILDPQGHIEYAAGAIDDGEILYLVTERSSAHGLADWLNSMRFALRVEVTLSQRWWIIGSVGNSGVCDYEQVKMTWNDPWPGVVDGGAEYFRGSHPGKNVSFHIHLIPKERAREFWQAWSNDQPKRRAAGMNAWEAVRIAAWRPRLGYETDGRSMPAELDWLRTAVHTNKGCYRGQEAVARILNLGRPARRLVFLQLDGSRGDIPQRGQFIELNGRRVGMVTSVARHADMGPIALALVSRALPPQVVLDLDGIAAAQELIVPVDGKSSVSPKERPGAGLHNPELRRPDIPALGGKSIGSR